jgi:dipeptidyl aminopeptidase/acylaminoacyl peptidase
MLSLDRQEIINNIFTPLLILQGGKDDSAAPEKASEMIQALKQYGKNNIDYLFYPEYDHALNLSFDEKATEIVLNDIQVWIMKCDKI